jgi:hypothetical protein
MLRPGLKSAMSLIIATTLCTCIDPYSPTLKGYESLLVVDGLITDQSSSYSVKLSKTIQGEDKSPAMIPSAQVFITDDKSESVSLESKGNGIYKTDSIKFAGTVGRTYILHIITAEGNKYESDPCIMQPVPEIDSIYFESDHELADNGTENREGKEFFWIQKAVVAIIIIAGALRRHGNLKYHFLRDTTTDQVQ